jgi:SAM-dependent methyltransferase
MNDHDRELARAFDSQAPKFERAPVQSDPAALERLVRASALPPGGRILDAGCGPGLVAAALLASGLRIVGVDLSREMIERARDRCAAFGDRATFLQVSVFDPSLEQHGPFDGAISRYVLHHVVEPAAFVARQVGLLRPGGVLVVCDHLTDPDPARAGHHERLERARDRSHIRSLTGGQIVDLFAAAGLSEITMTEEAFDLDFDEWFDRGSPDQTKDAVRVALLEGPRVRGFAPTVRGDGSIRIESIRAIVRGVRLGSLPQC